MKHLPHAQQWYVPGSRCPLSLLCSRSALWPSVDPVGPRTHRIAVGGVHGTKSEKGVRIWMSLWEPRLCTFSIESCLSFHGLCSFLRNFLVSKTKKVSGDEPQIKNESGISFLHFCLASMFMKARRRCQDVPDRPSESHLWPFCPDQGQQVRFLSLKGSDETFSSEHISAKSFRSKHPAKKWHRRSRSPPGGAASCRARLLLLDGWRREEQETEPSESDMFRPEQRGTSAGCSDHMLTSLLVAAGGGSSNASWRTRCNWRRNLTIRVKVWTERRKNTGTQRQPGSARITNFIRKSLTDAELSS